MIKQEIRTSDRHYGKVRCATCPKILETTEGEEYGMEALDQSAVNFLLGIASHHERLHPTHSIEVSLYERKNET